MNIEKYYEILKDETVNINSFIEKVNENRDDMVSVLNMIANKIAKMLISDISFYYECDFIGNRVFQIMITDKLIFNTKFPEPAYSIFNAIDEGEYKHENDNNDINPVEKYTIPQLMEIMKSINNQ